MDEIAIRPATAADQPQIISLVVQNNLNPIGLNWESFVVATDSQGEFVGCGQIKQHGDVDELASLVVVNKWQGRGASKVLMNALVERGRRPLWLMCESPLTSYYTQFGFAEVREPTRLPGYFQNVYWITRFSFGVLFLLRGTYVAFMVLDN